MGVSGSLYSGVSGLNANASAMSVIGNNIANANTTGFKTSRSIFGDLLSSQISGSGGTSQIGRGVGLAVVDNIFSQGTLENTETNTDLAIEGPGMFIVSNPQTNNSVNSFNSRCSMQGA
jgi:flagellar hook protein FlgE